MHPQWQDRAREESNKPVWEEETGIRGIEPTQNRNLALFFSS
jgi:hypothetical protein